MQEYWELLRLYIGTETLSFPAYLNIPDPCRSKRELTHLGLTILWIPNTLSLVRNKERINTSHKTVKAQKISFQSLLKVIEIPLLIHLATYGNTNYNVIL